MDPDNPINPVFHVPPTVHPTRGKLLATEQNPKAPRQRKGGPKLTPPIFFLICVLVAGAFAVLFQAYPQLLTRRAAVKDNSFAEVISSKDETSLESPQGSRLHPQDNTIKMSTEQT